MNDLYIAIFGLSFLGGLVYFWYKCQMFAVSKFVLLMGVLISPVGALVGIYWVIKDFFLFRNPSTSSKDKFESEINGNANNKNTTIPDQFYLQALENYENGDIDKALYARLFAENDGKEELIKAKYISLVVQKRVKSN